MQVTVGLTGMARAVAGEKDILLTLAEDETYCHVIHGLADRYPALVGLLINSDRETLMSGNLLIINGDLTTPAMIMDESPHDGDRLILMSLVTGG